MCSLRIRSPVFIVAFPLVLAACSDVAGPTNGPITELPRVLTASEQAVIAASNVFGLDLAARVAAEDARANVVLSPPRWPSA